MQDASSKSRTVFPVTHAVRKERISGEFTSHILFAFKNDECVTAVRLSLLVTLLMSMSVLDNPDLRNQLATSALDMVLGS